MDYGTNRLHLCDHWDNYGLSFVFPTDSHTIIVHGGGYNEPVVATITMGEYLDISESNDFTAVCNAFHTAADEFIQFVDALCEITVDTVYMLWNEGNLGILPDGFDNSDKFSLLVTAGEIVSIARAHKRSLGEVKNYA